MNSRTFGPTSWLRFYRCILAMLGLSLLATALSAQSGSPAVAKPVSGAAQVTKSGATTAWTDLRDALKRKLESAIDPQATMPEVLAALQKFADDYQGSEEAAVALFNHGMLSLELGLDDAAERSLRQAAALTKEPQLAAAIKLQLKQSALRPGKFPPEFAAPTLSGGKVAPQDYRGRVLLIDFWATWCGPCLTELPNVQRVYREHHVAGFEIVSVSLDRDKAALSGFLAKQPLPWTHVFNAELPEASSLAGRYGVTAIPQMVLIGRDGKIVGVNLRGPALAEAVTTALAQPAGTAALNRE